MNSIERLSPGAAGVVLGAGINGLGQVRALGRAGVRTYCVAPDDSIRFGSLSRYSTRIVSPDPLKDPGGLVDLLLKLARRQQCKPMLLFAGDQWLRLCATYERALREAYVIPQSSWSLLGAVLDKQTLHAMARKYGTPEPYTCIFDSLKQIKAEADSLPFPCVLKLNVDSLDQVPATLRPTLTHRVTRYESCLEMVGWLKEALACGFDCPALIQEFIPGGAEALYTLTSYTNMAGKLLAGSVGHKVRQYPPYAGGITVGRLQHVDAVFEQGRRFLEAIQFHGLANTEFKYDSRDGSYRLMEINPRLGLWNGSVLFAGLNLPLIAYDDMQGIQYGGPTFTRQADGALWLDTLGDAMNCIRDYGDEGYKEHDIGFWKWLRSIRGRKVDAVWRWTDPMPGLVYFGTTFQRRFKGLLRRLAR